MIKSWPLFVICLNFITKLEVINCNENLFTSARNNVYYIDRNQKYNWYDALAKCVRMNMSLVTIDTQMKSSDLTMLLIELFRSNMHLWAGGCASGDKPREFYWISNGQKFHYTNWANYQPDFKNNNEYCLQIGWNNLMQWNDQICHSKSGLICENSPLHDCQVELETLSHIKLEDQIKIQHQDEVPKMMDDILQSSQNVSYEGEHFRGVNIYINNYYK